MENPFKKKSKLDDPIDRVLAEMETFGPGSEEYTNHLAELERLMKLKCEEHGSGVSPDTLVAVGGNLLGILVIVAYEQKHVMVSKALGMLQRTKTP